MARSTTMIDSATGTNFNTTGSKVRADAYYGYTDGMHTVAFYLEDFTGKIFLEATLATEPTESDWFAVAINPPNEFLLSTAHTGVIARTFNGNFVYARVRVNRDYLSPANNNTMQYGQLTQVLLNH